jgi:hypothetical protein
MHLHVSLVARLPTPPAPRFDQHRFICCAWFLGVALSQLLACVDLQLLNIALHRVALLKNQSPCTSGMMIHSTHAQLLARQGQVFSYLSPEERVRKDHPLRAVRGMTDEILREMSPVFDGIYARRGRPSIPPVSRGS